MALPAIFIFTSKGCPHCVSLRGDNQTPKMNGDLITRRRDDRNLFTNKWNAKFIIDLMTAGDLKSGIKFRVFMLHFGSHQTTDIFSIVEYSEFHYMNNSIVKYTLKNVNNQIVGRRADAGGSSTVIKKERLELITGGILNYGEFIKTKIPNDMINFIGGFPSIVACSGQVLADAIARRKPLYAVVYGFNSVKNTKKELGNGLLPNGLPSMINGYHQYMVDTSIPFNFSISVLDSIKHLSDNYHLLTFPVQEKEKEKEIMVDMPAATIPTVPLKKENKWNFTNKCFTKKIPIYINSDIKR